MIRKIGRLVDFSRNHNVENQVWTTGLEPRPPIIFIAKVRPHVLLYATLGTANDEWMRLDGDVKCVTTPELWWCEERRSNPSIIKPASRPLFHIYHVYIIMRSRALVGRWLRAELCPLRTCAPYSTTAL